MNKFVFLGRISKEPEVKYTQDGKAIYNGNIAVSRKFKREGEPTADFFNIVAFGPTADFMSKYFVTKGQQILVEGRIQNKQWQDQNGETRYGTDYIVDNCYFADSKQNNTTTDMNSGFSVSDDDDLPF